MIDLPQQYSQLCALLDNFLVGVITVSASNEIVSINKSAEAIIGCKESELVGKSCSNTFVRELCGGECRFGKTFHLQEEQGRTTAFQGRSITTVVSPLADRGKTGQGCVVVIQDHSAFKELIDRVRNEDRRLKIILDNLDIGILTVDRGGHITFFNSMAEAITGFSRGDILGRRFETIFGAESSREISLLKETIADGKTRSDEEGELVTREGRKVPVRTNHLALRHEDGRIAGGLVTITDLSLVYELNSAIKERYTFYDIVGKDPAMQKIFDIVPVIASSDSTVLITGPTGTGKDLLARVIHNLSARSEKPMVTVNCAALPDNLLESEMFGYARGAFTGAERDKPGRFQEAEGGTIFLDEIGELPLSLQAKLLQVLEKREFYPLGSRKTTRVNVRIIAATNQDLEQQAKEKRFREDLYYRLNVINLRLPELKERRADLPLLIHHILNRICARKKFKPVKISEQAMEALLCYDYPGNVRELENILEYSVLICRGAQIEVSHLPVSIVKYSAYIPSPVLNAPVAGIEDEDERQRILATLRQNDWGRASSARALKIDRATLWRKMKKYDLL